MITKILCVDDDLITLMLCKKVISKVDSTIKIETAKNGKEALDYIATLTSKEIPQFILLDLNMPVMDGWEFLKNYTEEFYSKFPIKIIILSSTIDIMEIEKSKTFQSVINFISKPLTTNVIEELVKKK